VLVVLSLGEVPVDPHQPQLLDAQSLRLDPAQDHSDQAAADGVGLDDDQRRFLCHPRS
jgi:hypothetical protein